jgi:hypothetical protein
MSARSTVLARALAKTAQSTIDPGKVNRRSGRNARHRKASPLLAISIRRKYPRNAAIFPYPGNECGACPFQRQLGEPGRKIMGAFLLWLLGIPPGSAQRRGGYLAR